MKINLLCPAISMLLIMSISILAFGQQPPDTLWTSTFGLYGDDCGESVIETSDGKILLLGNIEYWGVGGSDYWMIKMESDGSEIWDGDYGGMGSDYGESVTETSDGGYLMMGTASSTGAGAYDLWLIKTDSEGSVLWSKTFGGSKSDYGYSVTETSDGGIISLGATSSFGAGAFDFLLVKTDGEGNELWKKSIGGVRWDYGRSVLETSDGSLVLLGATSSYGAGKYDFLLIKTDSEGNEIWMKTFGGKEWDYGYSIERTSDGGFVLLGYTGSYGAGKADFWLIKTDSDGNEIWNKTFGGKGADYGRSVKETSDGGFVLFGYSNSFGAATYDFWLVKTDSEGNEIWNKTFGGAGDDYGKSITETSDGEFILFGDSNSYGNGDQDLLVMKVAYPPSLFSLDSPVDGDTIISGTIEFDWEDSVDPYSGELGYDLYLDIDAEFTNPEIIRDLHESAFSYSDELLIGKTYYWKVCATSSIGLVTWSNEINSFLADNGLKKSKLTGAEASDGNLPVEGIDSDDYVQLTFDSATDKPEIDASNIDYIFRLSGGHTWLDEAGMVKDVIWNDKGDKVTIYLSTVFSSPTVAPGDTIRPYYSGMLETPCIITGDFDPSSVNRSNIPSGKPSELTLYPNRPNPFNPVTTITVGVPREGRVIVSIFDLQGRLVMRLFDGIVPAGVTGFVWNADRLSSGVYLCRVEMPDSGTIRTRKMMLLK